jgi:hypothetical protein
LYYELLLADNDVFVITVGGDTLFDSSKMFLITDFVNLKIKLAQSFGYAHRGRIYVHIFIEINIYTCMSIYVYYIFLKNVVPVSFTIFL